MSKVDEYLARIPAKRWYIIALRTELSEATILNSPTLTACVAANEKHRIETGRDDFDRFLNLDLDSLYSYLDPEPATDPAGDEDQDEDVPSRFPGESGDLGVAADQGAVLPGDADSTV